MNPLLLDTMLKEKRREFLEEAARQQLVAIYNANNPGWWARSQLVLGDFLIHLGEKIKARYSRPLALDNDIVTAISAAARPVNSCKPQQDSLSY